MNARRLPIAVLALFVAVVTIRSARGQDDAPSRQIDIADVRLGFANVVKANRWVPIAVDISTQGIDFQGTLTITTPDAEDNSVSTTLDGIIVPRNSQRTVRHFIKIASEYPNAQLTLRDQDNREWSRKTVDPGSIAIEGYSSDTSLILALGPPDGLAQLNEGDVDVQTQRPYRVIVQRQIDELPSQWYGYDALDVIVLATDSQPLLDAIDPARASAIQSWVRRGGRLIVSAANNWQNVSKSFLAPMLPAKLTGLETVGKLSAQVRWIDGLADNRSPLTVGRAGLRIATLEDLRGRTSRANPLLSQEEPYVAVDGMYGFGNVTLITFDTDAAPFAGWDGREKFWQKMLGKVVSETAADFAANRWNRYSNEVSNWISTELNRFPEITIVPFSWVALLIVGYILLIGPIDYFFLKKVVGKLELTWLTFPLIVALVSIGAYYTAYWLKGEKLLVNRVEIVDIDQPSRTLRGSGYLSIFSPTADRYTVSTTPGLAVAGSWSELGMGPAPLDRITTWYDASVNNYYGRGRSGGTFFGGGYLQPAPDPVAVVDAPIKVWSVKTFSSQWLAQAQEGIEADLKRTKGAGLTGTIKNNFPFALAHARLVVTSGTYARQMWIGSLSPKQTYSLDEGVPNLVKHECAPGGAEFIENLTNPPGDASSNGGKTNHNLKEWSLDSALEMGRVILLAEVDKPLGKLWINEKPQEDADPPPVTGIERNASFLRVVLDVAEAPSDE